MAIHTGRSGLICLLVVIVVIESRAIWQDRPLRITVVRHSLICPDMSSTVALFLCQGRTHLTMAYLLEHPHEGQERIFGSPILEDYFGPHSCSQ